jgi:hypothetical protein
MTRYYGYIKSEKALLSWVVNLMRRKIWNKHPSKLVKLQEGRVRKPIGHNGRLVYSKQCEHCEDWFREADIQINHKVNCIKNGISWEELGGICRRMFDVTTDDLECLCKDCHDLVTYTERYGGDIKNAKIMKKVIKFDSLLAPQQKEKLLRAGMVPAKTKPLRRKQVEDYLNGRVQK